MAEATKAIRSPPMSPTHFSLPASTTPPPPPGNPPATTRMAQYNDGKPPFDIVATYLSLLSADADLTMPVAAIESLIQLLNSTSTLTTMSETLDLLATAVAQLKRSIPNPISLSAGTDLFQRYLISTLQGKTAGSSGGGDFKTIRTHLLRNGRLFVQRAEEARRTIAEIAQRFVRSGTTVLTNGGSRVVGAVLRAAAATQKRQGGSPRFRVVYVADSGPERPASAEGADTIAALRAMSVPVAVIPEAAVAYSLGKVDMVLVGAEGVVENGGIISRMGTYQMAILARAAGKAVYVVAESHKFVRMFPLGQYDLGVEQRVIDFKTEVEVEDGAGGRGKRMVSTGGVETWEEKAPTAMDRPEDINTMEPSLSNRRHAKRVDYTPPDLITALITESGVHTPSAVSEELIKIWY